MTADIIPVDFKSEDIAALVDAMWQLLDDMRDKGQSVCLAAKAEARIAFEPFRDDEFEDWMTLSDAKAIIAEIAKAEGRR